MPIAFNGATAMSPASQAGEPAADAVSAQILDIIAKEGLVDRNLLKPEATLDEVGVASVDVVMILNEIEEVFGIYVPIDQSLTDIRNVGELVQHIAALIATSDAASPPMGVNADPAR